MVLNDYELVVGLVMNSYDPEGLGRIQLEIPGIFESKIIGKENLPWVRPLIMKGHMSFSILMPRQKVMCLKHITNPKLIYYIGTMPEIDGDLVGEYALEDTVTDEKETMIYKRDNEGGKIELSASLKELKITYGENNGLMINTDNSMHLKNEDTGYHLKNNICTIGGDGGNNSDNGVIKSDEFKKICGEISEAIGKLQEEAGKNSYTGNLASPLGKLKEKFDKFQGATPYSTEVYLNK